MLLRLHIDPGVHSQLLDYPDATFSLAMEASYFCPIVLSAVCTFLNMREVSSLPYHDPTEV